MKMDFIVPLLRPTLLARAAGFRRARSEGKAPPSPSPLRSAPASGVYGRPEAKVVIVESWMLHGN
jgi:hypothetical protein